MLQPVSPRLDWALLEGRMRSRNDEIDDLMALLLDHADRAAGPKADLYHVAWQIACASLGDQHLWQDLGLPSRDALSALILRWFPALKARNAGDMRWKKFFYRQLCERAEIMICKSPSCAACSDVGLCFGPETASTVQRAEAKA
jgi:nitrogen fixation protein NifQ